LVRVVDKGHRRAVGVARCAVVGKNGCELLGRVVNEPGFDGPVAIEDAGRIESGSTHNAGQPVEIGSRVGVADDYWGACRHATVGRVLIARQGG
jgi:hypothetical protein